MFDFVKVALYEFCFIILVAGYGYGAEFGFYDLNDNNTVFYVLRGYVCIGGKKTLLPICCCYGVCGLDYLGKD